MGGLINERFVCPNHGGFKVDRKVVVLWNLCRSSTVEPRWWMPSESQLHEDLACPYLAISENQMMQIIPRGLEESTYSRNKTGKVKEKEFNQI